MIVTETDLNEDGFPDVLPQPQLLHKTPLQYGTPMQYNAPMQYDNCELPRNDRDRD